MKRDDFTLAPDDLREMLDRDEAAYRELFAACGDLLALLRSLPQPVMSIANTAVKASANTCRRVRLGSMIRP